MGRSVQDQCCEHGVFWLYLFVIVGLLLLSGLMSGLTLGLMSLGLVDLEVIAKSGKPEDREQAKKIIPVVRNQHLLLVTLLVGNAIAMEALPLFLDALLVKTWMTILFSITLLVMFGEILPQAICSRYGLTVGATMAPFVKVLLYIMFPIAWPVSKLLDKLLGSQKHDGLVGREELKTLVDMHSNEAGNGGVLSSLETRMITGVLDLAEKTAGFAMTSIAETFSIDVKSNLDDKMKMEILASGHSRIPVYSGKPNDIVGFILVHHLLDVSSLLPAKAKTDDITEVPIREMPRISEDMPLYDVLEEFQQGRIDMAAVVRYSLNEKGSHFVHTPSIVDTESGLKEPGLGTIHAAVEKESDDHTDSGLKKQNSGNIHPPSDEQIGDHFGLKEQGSHTMHRPFDTPTGDTESGTKQQGSHELHNTVDFQIADTELRLNVKIDLPDTASRSSRDESGSTVPKSSSPDLRVGRKSVDARQTTLWTDEIEKGDVIGIITREDVLHKLLQQESESSEKVAVGHIDPGPDHKELYMNVSIPGANHSTSSTPRITSLFSPGPSQVLRPRDQSRSQQSQNRRNSNRSRHTSLNMISSRVIMYGQSETPRSSVSRKVAANRIMLPKDR